MVKVVLMLWMNIKLNYRKKLIYLILKPRKLRNMLMKIGNHYRS
nr:MAG TPA: hypothetical protein [Caudoviricetes sp.]